jgi:hypothetical protein
MRRRLRTALLTTVTGMIDPPAASSDALADNAKRDVELSVLATFVPHGS